MRIVSAWALVALSPAVALAQGLSAAWSVETPKDAPAVLIYGEPTTPQVGFSCVRKTGQVSTRLIVPRKLADHRVGEVWVNAVGIAAPWPVSVVFASSGTSSTLRGQAEAGSVSEATAVATEISTAAPVIQAFRKTGVISLTTIGVSVAPDPAKPGMVRKFLNACR